MYIKSKETIEYHGIVNITPYELKILEMVRDGDSNQKIADALGISVNTVKTI